MEIKENINKEVEKYLSATRLQYCLNNKCEYNVFHMCALKHCFLNEEGLCEQIKLKVDTDDVEL